LLCKFCLIYQWWLNQKIYSNHYIPTSQVPQSDIYNALSCSNHGNRRTKDLDKCQDMMGINVATFETFLSRIQTNIDGWSVTRQPFSCSSKVELWYPLWFLHIVPTLINVCYHHWQSMLWLSLPTWKVFSFQILHNSFKDQVDFLWCTLIHD